MNHWDRLQLQLRSERPDCLPIALWRHWPEHDADAAAHARAIMGWQRRFDFDLVRCMPSNTLAAEYWGATSSAARDEPFGLRRIERLAVTAPAQWAELRPGRPDALVAATDCVVRLAEALGGTAPLLLTLQSPFATALQIAGDAIFDHIAAAPGLVETGLRTIADAAAVTARRAIESGACGIALTLDVPAAARLDAVAFERFACAYDLVVLDAVRGMSQIDLLEVRGDGLPLERIANYPVHVLGCGDRPVGAGNGRGFDGILAGGLDAGALVRGSRAEVDRAVSETIERVGDRRALITTVGPCMRATPEANIDWAVDAVRRRIA